VYYCCVAGACRHLLVLICRVGRVTESGGEVGRLNVVGGAEVCSLPFVSAQIFNLIMQLADQELSFYIHIKRRKTAKVLSDSCLIS
jgi:hypothetical protein